MSKLSKFLILLTGTFILFGLAVFNGYPLVYSDTNAYIYSGMEHFIPLDRPIAYGLFLQVVSLGKSLWYVVLVQDFIMSFVLFEICQLFFDPKKLKLYFLLTLTFLVFFTGIGWYTNQVMPDFFSAVLVLAIFLLFYSPNISRLKYVVYSVLVIISMLVHFSHLLIGVGLILSILLFEYLSTRKITASVFVKSSRRLMLMVTLVVGSWFLHPTINYCVEKKFIFSKSSHVFLMAHLADNGILDAFLHENCDKPEYKDCKLCAYKDSLPTELGMFLWESNGVFQKTGWWGDSEKEYNKIIRGTLTKPKYILSHIKKTIIYTGIQLMKNEIGSGLSPYQKGSATYDAVCKYYIQEKNNYVNSKQYSFILIDVLRQISNVNLVLNIMSVFLLIILFAGNLYKHANILSTRLLQFSIIALVVNALVTAGLNAPSERFQARVTWLLTFSLLVFIFTNYPLIRAKLKGSQQQ